MYIDYRVIKLSVHYFFIHIYENMVLRVLHVHSLKRKIKLI